jgi:hypothetical protein
MTITNSDIDRQVAEKVYNIDVEVVGGSFIISHISAHL